MNFQQKQRQKYDFFRIFATKSLIMKASYLKRYPLSHMTIALVVILSLAPFKEIPQLENINLLDKWAHFIMYGGTCSVIWWEYWRQHTKIDWQHVALGAIVLPVVMGGTLELMQKYLTATRSGDWLDFVANDIGVGIGLIIGYFIIPKICKG